MASQTISTLSIWSSTGWWGWKIRKLKHWNKIVVQMDDWNQRNQNCIVVYIKEIHIVHTFLWINSQHNKWAVELTYQGDTSVSCEHWIRWKLDSERSHVALPILFGGCQLLETRHNYGGPRTLVKQGNSRLVIKKIVMWWYVLSLFAHDPTFNFSLSSGAWLLTRTTTLSTTIHFFMMCMGCRRTIPNDNGPTLDRNRWRQPKDHWDGWEVDQLL